MEIMRRMGVKQLRKRNKWEMGGKMNKGNEKEERMGK